MPAPANEMPSRRCGPSRLRLTLLLCGGAADAAAPSAAADAPELIRLAATGAPGALLVMWAILNASSFALNAPVFWFGVTPD